MSTKITRKIDKNKFNRESTKKYEIKKLIFKYLNITNKITYTNYILNLHHFQKYKKNSSISIIKNICTITGRYRGVLSFYKLSRIKLKEFGSMGLIPGLRKSS